MTVDRQQTRTEEVGGLRVPEEVATGIWRIGGGSWNGRVPALSAEGDGNVYLVADRGTSILIDCGTADGLAAIRRNFACVGDDTSRPTDLILTHSHWDHSDGAARWRDDTPSLTTHLNSVGDAFLGRCDFRLVGFQLHPPPHTFRPFRVDHAVSDAEVFRAGGTEVRAHHLPGHTPDSTLYVMNIDGLAVGACGDIVFRLRDGQRPVLGQLCTLWLSNLDDYVESLERLRSIPLDLLLPGHGAPIIGRKPIIETIDRSLGLARTLAGDIQLRENLAV